MIASVAIDERSGGRARRANHGPAILDSSRNAAGAPAVDRAARRRLPIVATSPIAMTHERRLEEPEVSVVRQPQPVVGSSLVSGPASGLPSATWASCASLGPPSGRGTASPGASLLESTPESLESTPESLESSPESLESSLESTPESLESPAESVPASETVLPQTPVVSSHTPLTQSEAETHFFLQLVESSQTNPPTQELPAGALQVSLLPGQCAVISVEPTQLVVPQGAVAGLNEHAPALQTSAHSPLGHLPRGSMMPSTAVHVPFVVARLHAWHAPRHALSQHTASAQKPLEQSVPAMQGEPKPTVTHAPPLHTAPPVQSALVAHEILHVVAPHTYGSHDFGASVHEPAPSHLAACVSTPEEHALVPHDFVLGA
jgi:hypothetical protein